MDSGNRIEITDKEGWRKEFIIDKRLIYVGSDSRNDIVLSPVRGSGVSPRHLQLIAVARVNGMINAVNLSPISIPLGESGSRILEPNSAMEAADGENFHLGEFTLTFHLQDGGKLNGLTETPPGEQSLPVTSGSQRTSIGLRVSLPQSAIVPEIPMEGIITVSNLGNAPGVQFKLWVEGLPSDCYEIGLAPILFPGAEKGIPIRLYHPCQSDYVAGVHRLAFRVEAPETYPGETTVVNRDIRFLPYYSHTLRLLSVG